MYVLVGTLEDHHGTNSGYVLVDVAVPWLIACFVGSHGPWELPLAGFIRVGFFYSEYRGLQKKWGSTIVSIKAVQIITLMHMSMDGKLDILHSSPRSRLRILIISNVTSSPVATFVCLSSPPPQPLKSV
jgi:hypothetical protein